MRTIFTLALTLFALIAPVEAKVFLTQEEALKLAFPNCAVQKETHYLTETQIARAAELADEEIEGKLVHSYAATCNGKAGGTAYFDAHRVRTLPETLMVVVAPDHTVRRIEVLAFSEPEEYLAKPAWYSQFYAKKLGPELQLKKDIRGIVGASLTARATTEAVRRVLALHQVLLERAK